MARPGPGWMEAFLPCSVTRSPVISVTEVGVPAAVAVAAGAAPAAGAGKPLSTKVVAVTRAGSR